MSKTIKNVGFIGLGEMGVPMAINLQKSGIQVYAFDLNSTVYDKVSSHGIIGCSSIIQMTDQSDAIITMVRDLPQTESVIFGENGITSARKKNIPIIIMSTLSPDAMHSLQLRVEAAQFDLIDAPVSGSLTGAIAATLTIMLSGKPELLESCTSIFRAMGKNIIQFGEKCGAGQAAKLTNNLVLANNIIGCSEALKFGKKHKISQENILKLLSVSTGGSWVVDHWNSDVSNYKPQATLGIIKKDIVAVLNDAESTQLNLPFTTLSKELLFKTMEDIDN